MSDYPTRRAVSAALTKDGHSKSESRGTRIRGISSSSHGFDLGDGGDEGPVYVAHYAGRSYTDAEHARNVEVAVRKLKQYADTLTERGYTVEDHTGDEDSPHLLVTAKPAKGGRK